jgi:hypothetical protein
MWGSYKVILWRVGLTIVLFEAQQWLVCVFAELSVTVIYIYKCWMMHNNDFMVNLYYWKWYEKYVEIFWKVKGRGKAQAQRGLGELRLLDFLTSVVGCQPHAPAAFTPRDTTGTHFHEGLSRPQEENISLKNPVTRPEIDPRTVRLIAQRLNYYATPGPILKVIVPKVITINTL